MGGEQSDSSPLMAPAPIAGPSEIDLEAGPDVQIQCRICLETDGKIPNVSLSSFICELVCRCRSSLQWRKSYLAQSYLQKSSWAAFVFFLPK